MTEAVRLEEVSCPLGCSRNDEVVTTGRDLISNLPGEYVVVKCRTCGLIRTNPRPTTDTIGLYYPDDYGPYLASRVQNSISQSSSWIGKRLTRLVKRVFNFNTAILPKQMPGRMLEIGCASGSFLHRMKTQGWQVQGIEFSPKAAQEAVQHGYQVHSGSLETAPKPDAPFDLIVGWMVLEHLHDPVGSLRKLRDWAKPGAWLVLSVPNAGSLEFRLFKDKWYALHLPNHLYHFNKHTLKMVLDESGWQLEAIHHQRLLTSLIASFGYVLRDKGFGRWGQVLIDFPKCAGRWNYLLFPLAWLFGLFGQTGRITVWAKVRS